MKHRLRKGEADDVTQDILLKMRTEIEGYKPEKGQFRKWLRRITRHACIDYFRRDKDRRFQRLLDDPVACSSLEEMLDDQAHEEAIGIALNEIQAITTPRNWAIFYAMTFSKTPAAELAKTHEMTIPAIYTTKHRVLEKVKARARELDDMETVGDLSDE
jgi:RNA polymerase sigma factor (sigma-70 family)